MTIDPEMLMAYADGELDALSAKRIERAAAADPAVAARIAAHRDLRARLADGFGPVADEAVPDRLAVLLAPPSGNVVAFPRREARRRWWPMAGAIAASLVVGLLTGQALRTPGPVTAGPGGLIASGGLADALDTQLAVTEGDTPIRMIASFRATDGALCRTFSGQSTSGIACRDGGTWTLRHTASAPAARASEYRQAGSGDAAILAVAQDMMAGAPLDAAGEAAAKANGWK